MALLSYEANVSLYDAHLKEWRTPLLVSIAPRPHVAVEDGDFVQLPVKSWASSNIQSGVLNLRPCESFATSHSYRNLGAEFLTSTTAAKGSRQSWETQRLHISAAPELSLGTF